VTTFQDDLSRYEQLILGHLPPLAPITAESIFAAILTKQPISNVDVANVPPPARPIHRALLVYSLLQSFRLLYESLPRVEFGKWDESLRGWSDTLENQFGETGPAQSAWDALALQIAGKVFIRDAWTDLAADTFGRLARAQQPSGAFLAVNPNANPEIAWYDELAILHAAASFAVQTEDRTIAAAVLKASDFHFRETQPDHATHQPWGIFAFIWNSRTRPLADQLLHNLRMTEKFDGISLMLLADALYCVRLFL
jgi:hypothetical protein